MACYVHHVPGRLRVKTLDSKNDPVRREQIRSCLQEINGVLEAEANPITGSIVLKYDVCRVSPAVILDKLRNQGYIPATYAIAVDCAAPGVRPVQKLTDTLVTKLAEMALERSAAALIAAII
jgi:copper chaperone CopZ